MHLVRFTLTLRKGSSTCGTSVGRSRATQGAGLRAGRRSFCDTDCGPGGNRGREHPGGRRDQGAEGTARQGRLYLEDEIRSERGFEEVIGRSA